MAIKTLVTRCAGLNNRLAAQRLRQYDPKTGITDLSEGVNIDIDDSGQISSRLGQISLSTTASHSLFQNKGDAFVAQDRTSDAAIYRVNNDFSLTGLWSGLVKGLYFSWTQVGAQTFYTNGSQNGYFEGGVRASWPDQSAHVGANTTREFYPAPVGSHIEWWLGMMWVAIGNVVYVSEPYTVGKFNMAKKHFVFGADVAMMKGVDGGLWVSTTEEIGFIKKADAFKDLSWVRKDSRKPAHEWSVSCQLVDLSDSVLELPGESAMWSSDDGLCVGTEDGRIIVVTEDKLIYPTGAVGATVVHNGICINTVG